MPHTNMHPHTVQVSSPHVSPLLFLPSPPPLSPLPLSQSYGRPSDLGREIRVFVQSVTPGSPAFMSGLFPGDTILEVNGVSVRSEPVAAVVKRITDVPRKSENKLVCVYKVYSSSCCHSFNSLTKIVQFKVAGPKHIFGSQTAIHKQGC